MITSLTSATWWRAAGLRILKTIVAIAIPYLGVAALADVPWIAIASAAVLGAIGSLITSLLGLPDDTGSPLLVQLFERGLKTFLQALLAGIGTDVFVTQVEWLTVLQTAALATALTLLTTLRTALPSIIDAGTATSGTASVLTSVTHLDAAGQIVASAHSIVAAADPTLTSAPIADAPSSPTPPTEN
ncbi:MAG TPA: holin [Gryllotalpicola sp.]